MRLPLADSRASWGKLRELSIPHRKYLYAGVALQIANVLITVIIPWMIGRLLDQIVAGTTQEVVVNGLLTIAVLVLVQIVLSYFGEYYATVFGERIFASLRLNLVRDYLRVPLSNVESAGSGDLISRGTGDIDSLRFMLNSGVSTFLLAIVNVIFIYAAALYISWPLGLIMLAFLAPFMFMTNRYLAYAVPAYKLEKANYARLDTHYNEALEQATTVEAFSMQHAIRRSYLRDLNGVMATERYTAFLRGYLFIGSYWLTMLPVALIIVAGVWMIDAGWTTLGTVTAVTLYALQLESPLSLMSWLLDTVQTATISLRRIFGVGGFPEKQSDAVAEPVSSDMSVQSVSFEYRPGVPVLSNVSLDIVPGETLAIVGPSGAGKSTLGRLLAGISAPTAGAITLGGVPLLSLPEADLRRYVVLVTQEHHVFLGTLRSNLQMVAPAGAEFSEDALWAALDAVEASTWVRALPSGLDTEVGAGKLELSAAQSQQLALARIVLLDPAVLVLDEATSLIDPTSARSLERSMRSVMAGRTVISIAHRLYTSHDADRIAVMIDGTVVELGSHAELVAAGGEYALLWSTWQHV